MKAFSIGAPIVSASIATTAETGEVTTNVVAKGDVLSDLVLAAPGRHCHPGCPIPPEDITIASATVIGFTLRPLQVVRGAVAIFDGVPTYQRDPNGSCYHGTLEETAEIDEIILEIPGETEDAPAVHRNVKVDIIKAIGGVAAGTTEDEDTTGGEGEGETVDPGTGEGEEGTGTV